MRHWEKIVFILVTLNGAARVWALPSYDPFSDATASGGTSYANGAPLYHQTNAAGESWAQWNGVTTTSWVSCTNSGLNYGDFPAGFPAPSLTNAVYLPGQVDHAGGIAGQSAALTFSRVIATDPNNEVTNAIYASFLLKVSNLGNLDSSSPIYFAGFATNSGDQSITLPSSAMKIFLKGNSATAGQSTSYAVGVANNSGSGSAAWDNGGHTSNDVLFVVVDYEFGINGSPDVVRLWVNPASTSFSLPTAPTADGSISISGANQIVSAADFFLLARTGNTLWGSLLVSDLRVGTTWSYVTGGPDTTLPVLSISAKNGNVFVSGVNGTPGATNFLLSSTNLLASLSNWKPMATNVFDSDGHVDFTNQDSSVPNQFFALKALPPPLGNPDLWIPACGAWLGAEVTNGSAANFSAHESKIGRQLDVLRIYHTPGSWTQLTTEELNYINAGRKLLESVKPSNDWTNAIGAANGGSATVDAQMTSLAQSIASIKPMKIMLIVFHEPQNNVTGSVPGADSGTPATYIAMWHNVRSIFDANGATNVIWCWDVQDYPPLRYLTSSLWPGNSYVDWVMWDEYQSSSSQQFTNVLADGYNWFTTNSTSATNYLSKPWGVAEWGVGINSYYPTLADQTNGINEMNDALNKNNQFPKIKLAAYYDDLASALLPGAFSSYSNFANSPYMMQQCSP